jgi:glutaredoxin
MKSTKFYSLDECSDKDKVLEKLDALADDRKIDYEYVEADLIKVKDLSLTIKESKDLSKFLHDNDVIEDFDFEEDEDDDEYGDDFDSDDDF